ncbi:DUF6087 family protein [Streptomyces sp. NPDC091272]|uniref:DUF6087 family protein n=1 Tax=Streptomyces sp. NPDC091272 TaxID=3365981 RepID=UPI0038004B55
MDDEPLSEWLKRREARIGRLRAVVADEKGRRATHLFPDKPRAIERWNGHTWELVTVVPNLAEAKRVLYPDVAKPDSPTRQPSLMKEGTGRHRKPPAT